jgi:hypothetical protein
MVDKALLLASILNAWYWLLLNFRLFNDDQTRRVAELRRRAPEFKSCTILARLWGLDSFCCLIQVGFWQFDYSILAHIINSSVKLPTDLSQVFFFLLKGTTIYRSGNFGTCYMVTYCAFVLSRLEGQTLSLPPTFTVLPRLSCRATKSV